MAQNRPQQYEPVKSTDQELGGQNEDEDSSPLLTPSASPDAGPRKSPDALRSRQEQEHFFGARKSSDEDELYDPLDDPEWTEETKEESKSMAYLFILTLGIAGLQISWTTELSNGSPFLLSLGLSKALLSFVWIAGPLMGVLVQPYIGILSDRSRSKYGKRRPFMVVGAAATTISFMALAWTNAIVKSGLGIFGVDPESNGVKVTAIVWAVLWVYILDFAINAVQAAIRAFIVDNAPTHQQEDANAWAGRLTGFGSILGYLSGSVDLHSVFPFLGNTQFEVLSAFACIALCATVAVSCFAITERDPRLEDPPAYAPLNVRSFFSQTFRSSIRLPPQIRKICEVQFFNWIGWFPFLFYTTTYIGQLFVNPIFEQQPDLPPEEVEGYWETATQVGSRALFINSLVSFAASIIFPILIVPSYEPVLPLASSASYSPTTARFYALLHRLRVPGLTLRRAWMFSHVLFAVCMAGTFFAATPAAGTVLVTLVGLSWALTMWAPFALISAEISKRDTLRRADRARRKRRGSGVPSASMGLLASQHEGDVPAPGTSASAGLEREQEQEQEQQQQQQQQEQLQEQEEDQAGVVLGLHNVAVSAPQILATLISSGIFKFTQRDRGAAGDESVAWVLRFGGLAALVAAFMTWRLKEEADTSKSSAGSTRSARSRRAESV